MHVDYVRRVVKEGISVDPNAIEITPLLFEKAAQSGRLDLRDLEDALARLPGIQRDVILFMVPNGASYNEAAKHFGIPVGTVRSRLSRGREALRRLMDRDNNERAPELDEAALKRIHLLLSGPPRSNRQISP
jgi:RNA polymerase sigma-70 factor, ECF subfamily